MEKAVETTLVTEKDSISWGAFILWPVVMLFIYVLSVGPIVMLADKHGLGSKTGQTIERLYAPLVWAYEETALRKPIGMYLHLWSKRFDQEGEEK